MPAWTRWAKSRTVSPFWVKMLVPLPYSCSLTREKAVSKLDAHDAEYGFEDLFAVDAYLRFDVVEEAGAEKESFTCG